MDFESDETLPVCLMRKNGSISSSDEVSWACQ